MNIEKINNIEKIINNYISKINIMKINILNNNILINIETNDCLDFTLKKFIDNFKNFQLIYEDESKVYFNIDIIDHTNTFIILMI